MAMNFEERLQTINREALTPPLQQARGSRTAQIIDWQGQQIHGGAGDYDAMVPGVAGLARFTGNGIDQGKPFSWSLIFKALPIMRTSVDPHRGTRELYAYRSGILENLPANITAPRFLGSIEKSGEAFCLWLEEVADEGGKPWPLSRFGLVARSFGQLNGSYLQSLPNDAWLSRKWLRGSVARRADTVAELPTVLHDPLMQRYFPDDTADRTFRLWAERETLLDVIERLPQTFCHMDVFPRNLFTRQLPSDGVQIVALDWAFTGIGALGEEIAPLIWGSAAFGEVDPAKLPELQALVIDSYLDGLHEAGWRGSPDEVRLGYMLASVLRFGFPRGAAIFLDKNVQVQVEKVFGRSMGEVIDMQGLIQRSLLQLADEVRDMVKSQK